MKKFTLSLILFFLALFTVPSVFSNVQAATLKFDPTSGTAANGATFQVKVNADAGSTQVSAADVYVSFDPTLVKATLVTPGTYFADVTSNILNGKVYITGLPSQSDFTAFKTGAGTIATITFQALKNGTASLKFDCGTSSASSKIIQNDINATNVIDCTTLGTSSFTLGSGGSTGTTGTTTGTTSTTGATGSTGTTTTTTTTTTGATATPRPTLKPASPSATIASLPKTGATEVAMGGSAIALSLIVFSLVLKFAFL